jgi:hypothetical protein
MGAAKIRRERASLYRIALFPQRNAGQRAMLSLVLEKRTLWQLPSRIPVGLGGTTTYFGKRSGPGLGSWARGFNFISLFLGQGKGG